MLQRFKLIPEPGESVRDMLIGVGALLYFTAVGALIIAGAWFVVRDLQGVEFGRMTTGIACFVSALILISLLILVEIAARNRHST